MSKQIYTLYGESPVEYLDRVARTGSATGAWFCADKTKAEGLLTLLRTYAHRKGVALTTRQTPAVPVDCNSDNLHRVVLCSGKLKPEETDDD